MAEIKLTKTELRAQQNKLAQLQKYLPTLQLKKMLLQQEVGEARQEVALLNKRLAERMEEAEKYACLLSQTISIDVAAATKVQRVNVRYENIAGVDIPQFIDATFEPISYTLFATPVWLDAVILGLRDLAQARCHIHVAEQKLHALEKELREVSIRVNLFEKILIPRAERNIRKVRVFLGDQELAAVARAKVAKTLIENKTAAHELSVL